MRPRRYHLFTASIASALGASCAAQAPIQPARPIGSPLVNDPQRGATPRLDGPTTIPGIQSSRPSAPTPIRRPQPIGPVAPLATAPAPPIDAPPPPLILSERAGGLPAPSDDPLQIDPALDPVLALGRSTTPIDAFRADIAAAVRAAPSIDEAIAERAEAQGARNEARTRGAPVADISFSSFRVLSRAFSNDPENILERSRPRARTDGLVHIQQPILDFGATGARVAAGEDRIDAAIAGIEDAGAQAALRAVAAWYAVYGYRALVRLGAAFADDQHALRHSLEDRVSQGAAASGDLAQIDGYIAAADSQLADFRRSLGNAEAQYAALFGRAPPADLARAPAPELAAIGETTIAADMDSLPTVRAARANAQAAGRDARALDADRYPQVSGAVDAGRYGVFETARDYDVRGTLGLTMRFGGGAAQRVEQAQARADGAEARLRRTRLEAERDARIAMSDVAALTQEQAALSGSYVAGRRARDVLVARFRVSRGTLADVVNAESSYFAVAARYVQNLIDLDTARYALLARTGRLLAYLDIAPSTLDPGTGRGARR